MIGINRRPGYFKGRPISITKTKTGVSVNARMSQIAWSNVMADRKHIAKYIAPRLKKAAGYVRKVAMNSMGRTRPIRYDAMGVSGPHAQPGQVPIPHQRGRFSIKNIQHSPPAGQYNNSATSRLVGVTHQNVKEGWRSKYVVPKMLEHGGSGRRYMYKGNYQTPDQKGRMRWRGGREQYVPVRYQKRPLMHKALIKSKNKVPHLFQGMLTNVK